jgi:ABC-type metal ion transport system substrate-binding protein
VIFQKPDKKSAPKSVDAEKFQHKNQGKVPKYLDKYNKERDEA